MDSSFFETFNFFEIHRFLLDQDFYQYIFPFLLVYAVFVAVLPQVKIFQNKNGKPMMPIIILISVIVAFIGVTVELSPGNTIGTLLMLMFPNISSLTIGILALYVVGSILGFDFFRGFQKDHSAYLYFTVGAIGLGSIVYYMGIVLGAWSTDPFDELARWNTILAVGFVILGVVFLNVTGLRVFGFLLLLVTGSFLYNGAQGSILQEFLDPFVFVVAIFIFLASWATTDQDRKSLLAQKLREGSQSRENIIASNNNLVPKEFESRVFDIADQNFGENEKKWKELYGDEDWRNYR